MASIGNWAYVLKSKLAVASARRGDDSLRLAHRVRHLGGAYYYAGRWTLAEPCYVEALSIYRRHERTRPLDLAHAIRRFAVLKGEVGAAEPLPSAAWGVIFARTATSAAEVSNAGSLRSAPVCNPLRRRHCVHQPGGAQAPAWLIFACVSRWRFSSDPSVGYH